MLNFNNNLSTMTTADHFKSYTDREHVLKRPDMYIGDIKSCKEHRWVIDDSGSEGYTAVHKEVKCNPGLEQCVLEILTNAADHVQRCKTSNDPGITKVRNIKVNIHENSISVYNDGTGIPIEKKLVADTNTEVYIPELIFGNLRTSSNYDDDNKKTWGGRNGIGAKATNIYSSKFIIELQTNGKHYTQEFNDSMNEKSKPKITRAKTKSDFTKITFFPNFKLFGLVDFSSDDTLLLIKKRVYDLSATTDLTTSIWFNDEKIKIKDFTDYMKLFIGNSDKVVYKTDRWEVGFALCPYDQATQISFVNSIFTEEGGSHVNYILDPLLNKVTEELQTKSKGITIKKHYIKDNLIVFIKAIIENPSFSSQLKNKLNSKVSEFGSKCEIPTDIIKKVVKLGITNNVQEIAKAKEMKDAMKKIDGTKSVRLTSIKKLEDANWAGTKKSLECTLILTEGDSAKGLALNGITSAGGRNVWGVFPLRGKFLNIRGATAAQLSKNEEIISINQIMGLKEGLVDPTKLRYGKIMIMSDQDTDGYHIKGLLINYFTYNWPKLVEQGLLQCMMTPIVKVFKGRNTIEQFYNLDDYRNWSLTNNDNKTRIKYYKGLGTSTAEEAKEYFKNIESNRIKYVFNKKRDMPVISKVFDKDQADSRKDWIKQSLLDKKTIDYNIKDVPVNYFIDTELVLFSISDNVRSIPSIIDGMKPSQRKVLYACLKKKLYLDSDSDGSIKVAQLSGYVSEQTEYHHGEVSLQGTIIKMAQEFVGSGNMNIMIPIGNFGTRISGEDYAAARYIYTALRPEVKYLFDSTDNQLLDYIVEDNSTIEPKFYVPVVPMILLNGSVGIGTGWSTNIPCFKLDDIVKQLKRMMLGKAPKDIHPYYKYFKGTITQESENCWKSTGIVEIVNKLIVEITELPVGMWKDDIKEILNKLIDAGTIRDFSVNDNDPTKTANDVCYTVKMNKDFDFGPDPVKKLIQLFKLEKNINGTNMVAFNEHGVIHKYASVKEILVTFFDYRMAFYTKRHSHITSVITSQIGKYSERLRFVKLVVDNQLIIFKKKKSEIKVCLTNHAFEEIHHDQLLSMPLYRFTHDEITALENTIQKLESELKEHLGKTGKDLWSEDLDALFS